MKCTGKHLKIHSVVEILILFFQTGCFHHELKKEVRIKANAEICSVISVSCLFRPHLQLKAILRRSPENQRQLRRKCSHSLLNGTTTRLMTISGRPWALFCRLLHVPVTRRVSSRVHCPSPDLCNSKTPTAEAPPRPVRGSEFYAGLDAAPAAELYRRARCSFEPGRSLQPEFAAGSVRDEAS